MTVTAAELAARVTEQSAVRLDAATAGMFLAYWLEHGIVEEPEPGRYRLTPNARRRYRLLGHLHPEAETVVTRYGGCP